MTHHRLHLSRPYPGGLRLVECHDCRRAFMAEVDDDGILDMSSRVPVNEGDGEAAHSCWWMPNGLDIEISIEMEMTI